MSKVPLFNGILALNVSFDTPLFRDLPLCLSLDSPLFRDLPLSLFFFPLLLLL